MSDELYYYVVRESWTDKQRLWKVLSRQIRDRDVAEGELDFHKSMGKKNRNHHYFLVRKEPEGKTYE